MMKDILNQQLKGIIRFRNKNTISLLSLIISTSIFIVITHITLFELSFDKYHEDFENIYRIQNNRIYKNLNDESAGCPPATAPTILKEIESVMYSTRIKPLTNSMITFSENMQQINYNHNNLFYADNAIFQVFTYKFIAGNPNTALDDVNKAVITRSFARKYFGNEDVLNKKFLCKNNEATNEYIVSAIIEDLPANSYLDFDCLLSFKTLESNEKSDRDMSNYWGWNAFNTYVKLKPNSDIDLVHRQFAEIVKKYHLSNDQMTRIFRLQPIIDLHLHSNLRHEIGRRNSASGVYILIALSIFILIVAWINYINTATVKSRKEILEISVKKILGCKKRQFITKYLTKSLSYNIFSLLLSIAILFLFTPWLKKLYDVELHHITTFGWIIIPGITFFLALSSGLYSSLTNYRTSHLTGNKTSINNRITPVLRNGLVVFQFIVSIVFIIATGVIIKQIRFMEMKQDAMNLENIISLRTLISDNSLKAKQKTFVDRIRSIGGVEKVSVSNSIPGTYYTNTAGGIRPLGVEAEKGIKCHFLETNEDYFDLYNVRLIEGQMLSDQNANNNKLVLINLTASKMLGFDTPREAINRQIVLGENDNKVKTIIGVIDDFYHKSIEEPIYPTIIDYTKYGSYISVKYHHQLSNNIIAILKKQWEEFYPDQPFDYSFNDKYFSDQYHKYRIFSRLVITFALFTIFVSCLGLYSLVRHAVTERIKEIGIRKVNGAKIIEVMTMLNGDFVRWIIIAFVIAMPFAWLLTKKWLENFAYKTTLSWWVFALGGIMVLGVALLTVSWQSWRAASRNPVEALRYE